MARRLTDLEIAVRIVPTMLRWPSSEATNMAAWNLLHGAVEALRDMLRALDDTCQRVERDHRLQPSEVRRRRNELGEQTLKGLVDFSPLDNAERAVVETIDKLEPKMQTLLMKALDELHEGVAAAKRAVMERCQIRAYVH